MSGPIQSIERAAAILRLLSGRSRRLGVVELAGQLGLPKGTVHGILRTLQTVGFVEQDSESGKYQLGAALLHIGSSYLDANELRTRALNWADALATQSDESVRIGTLHDKQVLIVHHVFRPDDSRQALEVGSARTSARQRPRKGAAGPPHVLARRARRRASDELHAGNDYGYGGACAESWRRSVAAAGRARLESCCRGSRRSPPRSRTAAASSPERSASQDRSSECLRVGIRPIRARRLRVAKRSNRLARARSDSVVGIAEP